MIGGIDIGGTKIAVGIVDDSGHLMASSEFPTTPERGLADGLERISSMLHEMQDQVVGVLRGVGIGCTGPVNPITGTIGNVEFLPGWENANLVEAMTNEFNLPVALENDADAAALGEARWGIGRNAHSFIYVTVSTGIGGGIVLDGQLYRGVDGAHPEIGHHVIDPSGPMCFCGASGCWESLASGPAMVRWVRESGLLSVSDAEMIDAHEICAAAERGESLAKEAVDREGYYLGLGLANLITLFAPDVIALGGGLMGSRHLFWDRIRETIQTNCGLVPYEKVHLVPATLGSNIGIIGAACVWIHRFGDNNYGGKSF